MKEQDVLQGTKTEHSSGPRKRSRKTGIVIFAIVVILAAAGVSAYVRLFLSGYQSTDDAIVDGNQFVVSSQEADRIAYLAAADGDRVTKGEVVVRLDDGSLKAQEAQAQTSVTYAEANAALAKLKLEEALNDLRRATAQYQSKIIPQEEYDHERIAQKAAQAQYNMALIRVKLARTQLDAVRSNLSRTFLASPADGVVAKRWVMPGDVVQPAQPIYTLYDLSRLWIEADFKETQIHYLRPGDPARITVDAYPDYVFTGKLEMIGAATASRFALIPSGNGSGNFSKITQRVPVRISIDNAAALDRGAKRELLPGMSAEVKIATGVNP